MNWTLSAFADEAGATAQKQIAALRRADLRFIDVRNVNGHNISALPLEEARTLKAQLDNAGIRVQMFGSPIGKIDITDEVETDLEKLRQMAKLAPILECNQIRIFSYYNAKGASRADWQTRSLDNLERLRSEAEKLGLILYHENERHIFGDLAADVQVIAQLRGVNFKLIFDFDNYQQSGENVWENWLLLRDFTDAIHLKDSTANHQHVPVGQGNGRVREILADAVKIGWGGPLAVEPHLSHSGAVAATGPSGQANEAYGQMPLTESFQVAVETARELLGAVGANWK